MIYIQRKGNDYFETVDEFETQEEAARMLLEYAVSDPGAEYYLSKRPCKTRKEKS